MRTTKLTNLISLLLFTAYSLYVVLSGQANLFFIIYLFFLDEVIKNIFIAIKSMRFKALGIDTRAANSAIRARFFMLFVYSIFIVIVFGLFYGLLNTSINEFTRNLMIFLFKDIYFNISVSIIILRESINLFIDLNKAKKEDFMIIPINSNIFILHLSIIFGGVMWFLTSGKFEYFHLSFGVYNQVAIIFPFIIIKFLFDLHALKKNDNTNAETAY
ncbi:DUF6498-containing protein [Pedobacter paludis]|uniref:Uncharacterized protein n=1 Tax=Pedobacter paludis TaxID=2203212 RepID=A0A317EZI8_9SPHI|nr:DUF6498-containing protein [Pedobacter paludis]PWS30618.1 hypothetical protein DF947_16955 [Pedobacter paludis]